MNIRKVLSIALVLVLGLLVASVVLAQTGNGYDLTWWTVDGGGGTVSGGSFSLTGSAGQPEPGPALTGGGYTLYSGFWPGSGASASPCPNPTVDVVITGLTAGYTNADYAFTAVPDPGNATEPIAYTWSADGLVSGQGMANATYNWASTGTHTASVIVGNCGGSANDNHTITLNDPPPTCDHPITSVSIGGRTEGDKDTDYVFSANMAPSNASPPISYTWSVDGLLSGQDSSQATYRWSQVGTHALAVSAGNCGGSKNESHSIEISGQKYIYLPLVLRNH